MTHPPPPVPGTLHSRWVSRRGNGVTVGMSKSIGYQDLDSHRSNESCVNRSVIMEFLLRHRAGIVTHQINSHPEVLPEIGSPTDEGCRIRSGTGYSSDGSVGPR